MNILNTLAFLVFPYLTLATFVVGHMYRYLVDPYVWKTKSSELLYKKGLKFGVTFFHWGIIFTLLGHGAGLLIPQRYWDAVGINSQAHTLLATYSGVLVGAAALLGLVLLIYRRISKGRILVTTTLNDFVTLGYCCLLSPQDLPMLSVGCTNTSIFSAPLPHGFAEF